jgi:hypothetical protein
MAVSVGVAVFSYGTYKNIEAQKENTEKQIQDNLDKEK